MRSDWDKQTEIVFSHDFTHNKNKWSHSQYESKNLKKHGRFLQKNPEQNIIYITEDASLY